MSPLEVMRWPVGWSLGWPSGWTVVAAPAAAVAVALMVPGPPGVHRLAAGDGPGPRRPGAAQRLLAGRPTAVLRPGRRWFWGAVVGLGTGLAGCSWVGAAGLALGLVAGVAAAVGLGWLEPAAVQRRQWLSVVQTPQVLDLLAAGLSAGLPLRAATAAVVDACPGPVAEDLAGVQQLIALGAGEVEAWRSLAGHDQLGTVAVDLARSVESGTRLVSSLTAHAADARLARRSALEVAARRVGVRSILPLMVCFIPAFLLLGVVPTVASALARAFQSL